METIILLKNNDLVKNTIVSGNIDVDKLIPACIAYQNTYLKPILGKALYLKLCTDFKAGTLAGVYLELYDDFVQPMVIYGGTALFLESAAYMVANSGITKLNTDSAQAVTKDEVDYLVNASQKLHNVYERDLMKWISTQTIPEYAPTSCGSGNRINVGGWSLKKRGGC
jgi:hypothetical protein